MADRAFWAVLAAALALAAGFVAAVLWAQAGYAGLGPTLAALGRPAIRHAVVLSLGTSTLSACLAVGLAIPSAYLLARRPFPGAGALDLLLDLPVVLSPVALGVSLLLFFRTGPGEWIETHLLRFVFEVPGIVLAQATVATALAVRVLKATFQGVDERYEHVARFLGCSAWGAFRRVTLPMARRGILAAFILAWARSVGEFGATVTLAGAVPGKTETVPVAIYLRLAEADITGAVALILLLSALSLGVLVVLRLVGGWR